MGGRVCTKEPQREVVCSTGRTHCSTEGSTTGQACRVQVRGEAESLAVFLCVCFVCCCFCEVFSVENTPQQQYSQFSCPMTLTNKNCLECWHQRVFGFSRQYVRESSRTKKRGPNIAASMFARGQHAYGTWNSCDITIEQYKMSWSSRK